MQVDKSDHKTEGSSGNENVDTILDFNGLTYECVPDLSVAVDRTDKRSPFQKDSYASGTTATVILNTGSDFINGKNSYLSFDVYGAAEFAGASFGVNGSAFNFIEQVTIQDRSGNEIERVQGVNHLVANILRWQYDSSYLESVGSGFGFNQQDAETFVASPTGTVVPLEADKKSYTLPLNILSGLFDFDQLLPAQLMSGLRMEITFATAANAVTTPATPTTTIKFSNVHLMLDSVKLTDSIMREMNERSANDGLEIVFRTWHTSKHQTKNSSLHMEVRKAVSRAFGAFAVGRIEGQVVDLPVQSRHGNQAQLIRNWQWRAGNLYYPQQKVANPTLDGQQKHTFQSAHKFFNKHKHSKQPNSCTLKRFEGDSVPPADKRNNFSQIYPVDLERTTLQDLSGIPLNNSRVLSFSGEFNSNLTLAVDEEYVVTIFLQHLKIARVFMDNTEMEE